MYLPRLLLQKETAHQRENFDWGDFFFNTIATRRNEARNLRPTVTVTRRHDSF